MAFDLDNLGGLAAEVLRDTRIVKDEWGSGFEIEILRHTHPDWERYELNTFALRPQAEVLRNATTDYAFSNMAPDGARRGKKLTRAEEFKRMKQQVSRPVELTTNLDDLRELKPGIASILIKAMRYKGETELKKGGVVFDLSTAEGRQALMNHETWYLPDGQGQSCIPAHKRNPDGTLQLDETDEPVPEYLGSWNVGDAIAELCIRESKDLAAFTEAEKSRVLDSFGPVANGSIATGSDEAQTTEQPSPSLTT